MELKLDLSRSFWENIGEYHEKLKKLKKKIRKLEELIAKGEERPSEERKRTTLFRKRSRDWYEKFRWMFTSGGFLCIGGRDAKTNEILVRRYLQERDLFLHADVHGAPSVILKNGTESSEMDVREAAVFAASYSSAWKHGVPFLDVFFVKSDQVSLSPPSGEYRPKGGVMVYGKKQWIRKVPLVLYIGFDADRARFFVSANLRGNMIRIRPGDLDRREAIVRILDFFSLPKQYADDLNSVLPSGNLFIETV